MARDIWFTSDTHFNHLNMLSFKNEDGSPVRPFRSLREMNETIIDNWNTRVKPSDIIYHLGDVFFGSKDDFEQLWPRLNGKKRLIVGNHDNIKYIVQGGFFAKIMMWRVWHDKNLLFTHVPVHQDVLRERVLDADDAINIHGHTHSRGSPEGPYRSVCVEMTDYKPVHLEELI